MRAWLEAVAKLPGALVRLGTPWEGPWTGPLAVLGSLVSYMALATRWSAKNRSVTAAPRTHRHIALGFEAAVITAFGP